MRRKGPIRLTLSGCLAPLSLEKIQHWDFWFLEDVALIERRPSSPEINEEYEKHFDVVAGSKGMWNVHIKDKGAKWCKGSRCIIDISIGDRISSHSQDVNSDSSKDN